MVTIVFFLGAASMYRYRAKEIESFTFLVEGQDIQISTALKIEKLDVTIGLNFTEATIKPPLTDILTAYQSWQSFPAFVTDKNLGSEYLSLSSPGLHALKSLTDNVDKLLTYIDATPYVPHTLCEFTPLKLELNDVLRWKGNIINKYNKINRAWTPDTIRSDTEQQYALTAFGTIMSD